MKLDEVTHEVESVAQVALANSPIFALREIIVSRDGTQLMLSGRVSTFYYKQLAQEAVRAVVRDVPLINGIDVD